jgi:copper chaperone
MMRFSVPEMSCGHCKSAIESAVKTVDPIAKIEFDMENRVVDIDSGLDDASLQSAISTAGYESKAA